MPQKARLIFTKKSWGCLEGQTLVSDVTDNLTGKEGQPVLITEVKNPEDVDNSVELYLYFSAREIGGVPGYYVLRLGVEGSEAGIPGTLELARVSLVHSGKSLYFLLKAKTSGQLKSDLLYAVDMELHSGLFTCGEAGNFDAYPVNFFQAYTIWSGLSSTTTRIDAQWNRVTIPLDDLRLNETEAVADCYALLTAMEKSLCASTEHSFLWDQSQLTPRVLDQLASSFEQGRNLRYHVKIELLAPRGTMEIERDPTPFLPQLRQTISTRNANGRITGGSVMLAVEKLDAR